MYVTLKHPVCIFNITDELENELNGLEYRQNLLTVFIIEDADTNIWVNGSNVMVNGSTICFLTHNQPLVFGKKLPERCKIIQFNADVFCIQKHDAEVGCNGLLFNNQDEPPVLAVCTTHIEQFELIIKQMINEVELNSAGCIDMLESYLKQFLIQAVRIKKTISETVYDHTSAEHDKAQQLTDLIEKHYKEQRKISFYAEQLCISGSGLHKLAHKTFGRSLMNVLYEKLLMDAKALLFQTNNPVKEICYDLGFSDPAYFTRFFKKHSGISPETYRQTIRNSTTTV